MNKIALNPSDNLAVDLRRYRQDYDHFTLGKGANNIDMTYRYFQHLRYRFIDRFFTEPQVFVLSESYLHDMMVDANWDWRGRLRVGDTIKPSRIGNIDVIFASGQSTPSFFLLSEVVTIAKQVENQKESFYVERVQPFLDEAIADERFRIMTYEAIYNGAPKYHLPAYRPKLVRIDVSADMAKDFKEFYDKFYNKPKFIAEPWKLTEII